MFSIDIRIIMGPIGNYYKYLSIPVNSSLKIIKKAYRKKSLLVHPDKLKESSSDEFNKLKEIYDILSDPVKRAAYDKKYFEIKAQEEQKAKLTKRQKELREKFRAEEKEAKRQRIEKEKEKLNMLRKNQIMRDDEIFLMKFDKEMEAQRRKRMENIIKVAASSRENHTDIEYSEDEVMKMMGL